MDSCDGPPKAKTRAVCLKEDALDRLRKGLTAKWQSSAPSQRLTRALKAELLGLSIVTTERILKGQGVDRATLVIAFQNLSLPLDECDFKPNTLQETPVPTGSPEVAKRSVALQHFKRLGWLAAVIPVFLLAFPATQSPVSKTSKPLWRNEFNALFARGLDHYQHGRLDQAKAVVDELLAGAQTNDSARGFAGALRLSGDIAYGQGRFDEAESQFTSSLEAWQRLQSRRNVAELWEAIGNVQLKRGRLDEAKVSFACSLQGQEAEQNEVGMAMAHRGIGSVLFQSGDISGANERYSQGLRLLAKYKEPDMVNDLHGRLALVHAKQGKIEQAMDELRGCLSYWQKANSLRWIALTEMDLGNLAVDSGDHQSGIEHLSRSERGFQEIGDKANERIAHKAIAAVRLLEKRARPSS